MRTSRAIGRALACVLLLIVSVQLQSVNTALADLLGPRHAHQADTTAVDRTDPMAGWRDFRRAHYDHLADASIDADAAHALAHATGMRHRHDLLDTTVESLEMAGDNDGAASGTASASAAFVFIAAAESVPLTAAGAAIGNGWRSLHDARFRSADLRRLERPPQRLG